MIDYWFKISKTFAVIFLGLSLSTSAQELTLDKLKKDIITSSLTEKQKTFILRENFENSFIDPQSRQDHKGDHVPVKSALPYFKVPLDLVGVFRANRLDPRMEDALVFEEAGKKYVRWFIHPEDTKYFQQTQNFLKSKGLSDKELTLVTEDPLGLEGYLTASRSILIRSKKNGMVFSAKISTNYVGSHEEIPLEPKIMVGNKAALAPLLTNYVDRLTPGEEGLSSLILQREPLGFAIGSAQLGNKQESSFSMVIRDLGGLARDDGYDYLPAFSLEKSGKEIAAHALGIDQKKISNKEVAAFWTEHYLKPLARAQAELLIHYGIMMTAVHGQQFLIQMKEGIPTGKIVIRDFSDGDLLVKLVCQENLNQELIAHWPEKVVTDKIEIDLISPYANRSFISTIPRWFNSIKAAADAELNYASEFESEFSALTGIPFEHGKLLGSPRQQKIIDNALKHKEDPSAYEKGVALFPSYYLQILAGLAGIDPKTSLARDKITYRGNRWEEYLAIYHCQKGIIQSCNGKSCDELLTYLGGGLPSRCENPGILQFIHTIKNNIFDGLLLPPSTK
ncbi:MAG: hypothetical protein HQK50_05020 [Oligoflexia bacterium]|nr:hypothetical protein [Oligoflexia bacterium]